MESIDKIFCYIDANLKDVEIQKITGKSSFYVRVEGVNENCVLNIYSKDKLKNSISKKDCLEIINFLKNILPENFDKAFYCKNSRTQFIDKVLYLTSILSNISFSEIKDLINLFGDIASIVNDIIYFAKVFHYLYNKLCKLIESLNKDKTREKLKNEFEIEIHVEETSIKITTPKEKIEIRKFDLSVRRQRKYNPNFLYNNTLNILSIDVNLREIFEQIDNIYTICKLIDAMCKMAKIVISNNSK